MRVRVGQVLTFEPNGIDRWLPQHYQAVSGQRVRVIQLPSAPRPNTMGQCHIADATSGEFLGMVSTGSLQKRTISCTRA